MGDAVSAGEGGVSSGDADLILAIETSCDDTCCAVVTADGGIRANVISSQGVHDRFGGVVPEIAARAHVAVTARVARREAKEGRVLDEAPRLRVQAIRDLRADELARRAEEPAQLGLGLDRGVGQAMAHGEASIAGSGHDATPREKRNVTCSPARSR